MTDAEKKVLAERKKKQEQQFAKIINPKAFKEMNKTEFKKQYKGKLTHDLDTVWKWIEKNRKG